MDHIRISGQYFTSVFAKKNFLGTGLKRNNFLIMFTKCRLKEECHTHIKCFSHEGPTLFFCLATDSTWNVCNRRVILKLRWPLICISGEETSMTEDLSASCMCCRLCREVNKYCNPKQPLLGF